MDSISIRGVKHAYELTAPTATPEVLVFVHGWLLSRNYWQPLIQQLSATYQCLAYDLRGFGDSQFAGDAAPRDFLADYTPKSYAKDLSLLLEALAIKRAWLIGHSLGGTIALWAAALMPQRVRGAICINAGGGIYLKEEFERFRKAGQQFLKFRPQWLCHLPPIDLIFCRANVARPVARAWGRQRAIDFVAAHPQAALGALLESTTEAEVHRLPQLVASLQQPAYFIAGRDDRVMELRYVRHLASFHPLFQNGKDNVIEIPNCGHLAMIEHPYEVATHIQTILTHPL